MRDYLQHHYPFFNIKGNVNVKFEAMEKKLRIILERARDGVEPLEDLEQELLNLHSVSGISLEQLKLQKECYRERKERNGKSTAYGEAHTDEIREGVIDHLIALCNYR